MARRRRVGSEAEVGGTELNIVPFLDVVVNIMLFLLATTTAAMAVAQVDVELPPAHVTGRAPPDGLMLSVTLADRGIIVAGRGEEPLTIPRTESGYDFSALHDRLARVHASYPSEDSVVVTADPRVPYEDLIRALDAARGSVNAPLFRRVLVSAGVR